MNSQDTTYFDRLKISWLLFWRGSLMTIPIAYIWGNLVWALLEPLLSPEWVRGINAFGGYVFSLVLVGPLLIQMLLRKRFQGLRVELVRDR